MLSRSQDGIKKSSKAVLENQEVQLASRAPTLPRSQTLNMSGPQSDSAVASIEAIIGYRFMDRSLLIEALSIRGKHNKLDGNGKLALLGDAVLRLAVLDPWYQEGTITGILTLLRYQSQTG